MNNFAIQRISVWSGGVGVLLFFLGFVSAGFIPPPSPSLTPDAVVTHYVDHSFGIRFGMLIMAISGMFIPPLVAAISAHMKRIPGAHPLLADAQLSAGTMNALFFIIAPIIFLTAAYRPDRNADITFMLHDFAWIMAVLPWSPAFIECIIIAVAIFTDKSEAPIFPKWLAYLNVWVAFCYLPGGLLVFFKAGPFAWNGIFVYWLAGSVFIIWFTAMIYALLKATAVEHGRQRGIIGASA